MTWIKLHDNVIRHPKIARLTNAAFRWWIRGLCYASEFLTDGVLPDVFVSEVPKSINDELQRNGLWERDVSGTTRIHDYLDHQTSRATVDRERRRSSDRRTGGTPPVQHRARTAGTPPVHDGARTPGCTGEKPRPEYRDQNTEVQTPLPPFGKGGKRATREHREQAKKILQSRLGYCQHDPQCPNQLVCLDLIARELAQKAIA